jgi:glyoxylase-like metal-dependent hydrolase (beta-lactamase superfamily II)
MILFSNRSRHTTSTPGIALIAGMMIIAFCCWSQNAAAEFQQVAPDLYFNYDYAGSNSAVLITDDGVLVVDTRMHPDDGELLLAEIRTHTDAPIKYVVTSQFHGDHYMGNAAFEREGATFIAHTDTKAVILERFEYEVKNRPFAARGQDPDKVKLVLPDILFNDHLSLELGGRTVELMYLGAGQNKGDTLIYFPHAKALHTGGVFHNRSWANTSYTPSFEGWIDVLTAMKDLDVDTYIPPHGPLATAQDLDAFTQFIGELNAGVRAAIGDGVPLEEMLQNLTFEQYSEWRGYERRERNLTAMYQLMTAGEAQYFVPSERAAPRQ